MNTRVDISQTGLPSLVGPTVALMQLEVTGDRGRQGVALTEKVINVV